MNEHNRHSLMMSIGSRAVAVILTAFPCAAAVLAIFREERATLEELTTYEELRAYMESELIGSFWECFAGVLILGVGYTALVEVIAYLLRVPFRSGKLREPNTGSK